MDNTYYKSQSTYSVKDKKSHTPNQTWVFVHNLKNNKDNAAILLTNLTCFVLQMMTTHHLYNSKWFVCQ